MRTQAQAPAVSPRPASPLACPRCRSEDTKRLALVFAEGNSISFGSASLATGDGLGVASTVNRSQTTLSASAAPPPKRSAFVAVLIGLSTGFGAAMWVAIAAEMRGAMTDVNMAVGRGVVVGVGGLIVGSIPAWRWNGEEHPKLLREWNQKFLCRRCGEVFIPPMPTGTQRWR